MKFQPNLKNLLGKIKVWSFPVYNLISIQENLRDFLRLLEEKNSIELDKPFIQPPRKGTVLGSVKETIRFNYAHFKNKSSDWIEYIQFGFGENGYYYDCFIECPEEFSIKEFENEYIKISELLRDFEINLETQLENYYFNIDNLNSGYSEISNCQLNICCEFENIKIISENFKDFVKLMKDYSERIIKDQENVILPELRFIIMSDLHFSNLYAYNATQKYLERDRQFSLQPTTPSLKEWLISIRGVSLEKIISLLVKFFS